MVIIILFLLIIYLIFKILRVVLLSKNAYRRMQLNRGVCAHTCAQEVYRAFGLVHKGCIDTLVRKGCIDTPVHIGYSTQQYCYLAR